MIMKKVSAEHYVAFRSEYFNGTRYAFQRLGQAFCNHFAAEGIERDAVLFNEENDYTATFAIEQNYVDWTNYHGYDAKL
jgi:hypothetical protein